MAAEASPLPDDRKIPEADLRTIGVKHFALRVTDAMAASGVSATKKRERKSDTLKKLSRHFFMHSFVPIDTL